MKKNTLSRNILVESSMIITQPSFIIVSLPL